jgi:hypothetical protein
LFPAFPDEGVRVPGCIPLLPAVPDEGVRVPGCVPLLPAVPDEGVRDPGCAPLLPAVPDEGVRVPGCVPLLPAVPVPGRPFVLDDPRLGVLVGECCPFMHEGDLLVPECCADAGADLPDAGADLLDGADEPPFSLSFCAQTKVGTTSRKATQLGVTNLSLRLAKLIATS